MANVSKLPTLHGVDVPRVTPEQAAVLMVHHLGLAASYYEVTNLDPAVLLADMRVALSDPAFGAAKDWLKSLDDWYEENNYA